MRVKDAMTASVEREIPEEAFRGLTWRPRI
jgi:hypothetical protein